MTTQSPPKWALNAVATKQGWRHHLTGELLVSRHGLLVTPPQTLIPPTSPVTLDIAHTDQPNVPNTFIEIETSAESVLPTKVIGPSPSEQQVKVTDKPVAAIPTHPGKARRGRPPKKKD